MNQGYFKEVQMIFDILRRRKRILVITTFCSFMLFLLPIFLLPPIYQSTATILIESQEIPQELVRSTVTGYVEERLQSIAQIALNRANLSKMIEEHKLYAEDKNRLTTEEILKKMREDISMVPIQTDIISSSGRPAAATIAFSLSFRSKSKRQALNTTNSLISIFMEENYKSRQARATTTYDFLEKQSHDLKSKIEEIETEIARFKEQYMTALPEMVSLNLQTLERSQREAEAKKEYIRALTDRKIVLEGQLSTLSPMRSYVGTDGRPVLPTSEELKVLRNQYISMSSTKGEKHPDIISIKQKIAALEAHTGDNSATIAELERTRALQQSKLEVLKQQYSANHPEVSAAQNGLTAIDVMLNDATRNRGTGKREIAPDNPAYITVDTQLKSVLLDIENERRNVQELEKKYDEYQRRIEQSPQVEQNYRRLQRDLSITQIQYQENMAKLMLASEARTLETERAGERLTLIDPPALPETPISPNRMLILAVGVLVSAGLGGGAVAAREILDTTIHGPYQILDITKLPILVSISYYATKKEKARRSMQRKIIIMIGVLIVFGMVLLCHFVFMPLDVLFYTVQNKLKLYF